MFCPSCKRLMRPNTTTGRWICKSCGTTAKMSGGTVVEHSKAKGRDVAVIEEKVSTLPTSDDECPKCGNKGAFWVLRQTRGADEPETRIFECIKCGNKWREYQ